MWWSQREKDKQTFTWRFFVRIFSLPYSTQSDVDFLHDQQVGIMVDIEFLAINLVFIKTKKKNKKQNLVLNYFTAC